VRTHYCAKVNEEDIGQEITISGWVASRRDHGGVIFIDLRDKDEVLQLVCDPFLLTFEIKMKYCNWYVTLQIMLRLIKWQKMLGISLF